MHLIMVLAVFAMLFGFMFVGLVAIIAAVSRAIFRTAYRGWTEPARWDYRAYQPHKKGYQQPGPVALAGRINQGRSCRRSAGNCSWSILPIILVSAIAAFVWQAHRHQTFEHVVMDSPAASITVSADGHESVPALASPAATDTPKWTVTGMAKSREDAYQRALDKANEQVSAYLSSLPNPPQWMPNRDYVEKNLVEKPTYSAKQLPDPVGLMQQVDLPVEIAPKHLNDIAKQDRNQRRGERIVATGEVFAALVAVCALGAMVLRRRS